LIFDVFDSEKLINHFISQYIGLQKDSEKTIKSTILLLEYLKNIVSFTRIFQERYVQFTTIRKRMELA